MNKPDRIRHAIQELSLKEAQSLLFHIAITTDLAKYHDYSKEKLCDDLAGIFDEITTPRSLHQWEPTENCSHVHIVFGDSFAGSMKLAIRNLERLDSDKVIVFRDRYAIGPIWQLQDQQGRMKREEWFREHINNENEEQDFEEDFLDIIRQISLISSHAKITIWSNKNAQEQVGVRFAAYLLRTRLNEVFHMSAAETSSKTLHHASSPCTYRHSGEIPTDQVQSILSEGTASNRLSKELRAVLEREWLELASHQEVLRIWADDHIQHMKPDYLDVDLVQAVDKLYKDRDSRDFIKAARVIGEALGNCDHYVGDDFFEYRLRELIYSGYLEIKGVPRAMRYYSVRKRVNGE